MLKVASIKIASIILTVPTWVKESASVLALARAINAKDEKACRCSRYLCLIVAGL